MSQASTTELSESSVRARARRARAHARIGVPYLSTAEAAVYLNYSESHFRTLVRAGKVPAPVRPYGPNGKCLWHQTALDEHMRALGVAQGVIPPTAA